MIRAAMAIDAEQIAAIYNHYILNTVITFEEEIVSTEEIRLRLEENKAADLPWLVALREDEEIVGYAFASKWKGRCAYRFSAEVTVYLAPSATSQGWGTKLYEVLFAELKRRSIRVVIGGIALPNPGSIALHEKFGMEKVGHFSEVGFKFDRSVDVGYWQGKLDSATDDPR